MNEEYAKRLYNFLGKTYNMPEYEQFAAQLQDENQRNEVYNIASKHIKFDSYDLFNEKLGFVGSDGLTSEVSPEEAKENTDSINQFLENRDTLYAGLQDYDTGIVSGAEQRRRDDAAAEAEAQAEAMRQRLQEDSTIDRMKEAKKEARREKLRAFGSMLGSTPQVTSFGVSTNVFDSTDEQLADVGQALDAGTEYVRTSYCKRNLMWRSIWRELERTKTDFEGWRTSALDCGIALRDYLHGTSVHRILSTTLHCSRLWRNGRTTHLRLLLPSRRCWKASAWLLLCKSCTQTKWVSDIT